MDWLDFLDAPQPGAACSEAPTSGGQSPEDEVLGGGGGGGAPGAAGAAGINTDGAGAAACADGVADSADDDIDWGSSSEDEGGDEVLGRVLPGRAAAGSASHRASQGTPHAPSSPRSPTPHQSPRPGSSGAAVAERVVAASLTAASEGAGADAGGAGEHESESELTPAPGTGCSGTSRLPPPRQSQDEAQRTRVARLPNFLSRDEVSASVRSACRGRLLALP